MGIKIPYMRKVTYGHSHIYSKHNQAVTLTVPLHLKSCCCRPLDPQLSLLDT
jgi:hypothetical protein